MDNQLVQSRVWLSRLVIVFLAIMLLVGLGTLNIYWQRVSNPYAYQVMSIEGDPEKGGAIFQINCAGCHSLQADRNVGPRLENVSKRKSSRNIINQVTSGQTPPMPKFQPSEKEMADLLSYLTKL